jgi:hypothetical protein
MLSLVFIASMIASPAVVTGRGAGPTEDRRRRFGLCATCCHAETIASSRGAEFLLCRLAQRDARFPKYPRIPVVTCVGFAPDPAAPSGSPTDGT